MSASTCLVRGQRLLLRDANIKATATHKRKLLHGGVIPKSSATTSPEFRSLHDAHQTVQT
jgi:hypothetical protein